MVKTLRSALLLTKIDAACPGCNLSCNLAKDFGAALRQVAIGKLFIIK